MHVLHKFTKKKKKKERKKDIFPLIEFYLQFNEKLSYETFL